MVTYPKIFVNISGLNEWKCIVFNRSDAELNGKNVSIFNNVSFAFKSE